MSKRSLSEGRADTVNDEQILVWWSEISRRSVLLDELLQVGWSLRLQKVESESCFIIVQDLFDVKFVDVMSCSGGL